MLPAPAITFTIPSIHDDNVLDCRIYFPISLQSACLSVVVPLCRAAIVAHPYAPLGGSYDDPVVALMVAALLREDFVVGTFNFRGAGHSKGRTSWTARGEVDDYVSFIGFMLYFMYGLLVPSMKEPLSTRSVHRTITNSSSDAESNAAGESRSQESLLILAGYSYGSMITALLPNIKTITARFATPDLGTAASEIRLRADKMASTKSDEIRALSTQLHEEQSKEDIHSSTNKRGRTIAIDEQYQWRRGISGSGVRLGGEESDPAARPRSSTSHDRRSFDTVRRSIDQMRHSGLPLKFPPHRRNGSHNSTSSAGHFRKATSNASVRGPVGSTATSRVNPLEFTVGIPRVAYVLVSPIQGVVQGLATLWRSTIRQRPQDAHLANEEAKMVVNSTLAIYGDEDFFTSKSRLRRWADTLRTQHGSKFEAIEVTGAGHFWHEDGVAYTMRDAIHAFVQKL